MLSFELKKIHKQKIIITTILFSFFISLAMYFGGKYDFKVSNSNAPARTYIMEGYFCNLKLPNDENRHLSKKQVEEIMERKNEITLNYIENREYVPSEENFDEDIRNFTKEYYSYILKLEDLRKEYNLVLSEEDQRDWEWILFESKYNVENNLIYNAFDYARYTENPIRTIIGTSGILFGIPAILFLIFMFSSIVSKEKEKGSINLLMTQPYSRFKIIFSKWIMIVLMGLLYTICTLIFSLIIYKLAGFRWFNGHLEIYRVFGNNNLEYIIAYKLLIKIILSFIAMVMFFASLITLISSKIKDSKSVAVNLMLLIVFLSMLSDTFAGFKTVYNPIYAMNLRFILTGYSLEKWDPIKRDFYYIYNYSKTFLPYIIYIILSLILLTISTLLLKSKSRIKEKKNKIRINSIFKFEILKIIREKSFNILIFATIFLLAMSVFDFYSKDINTAINFPITFYNKQIFNEELKKVTIENKDKYLAEYGNLNRYYKDLGYYGEEIKKYKALIDEANKAHYYYKVNNSEKYYNINLEEMKIMENDFKKSPSEIVIYGASSNTADYNLTAPSFLESKAIYNYLKDNDIKTVKKNSGFFMSEYEKLNGFAKLKAKDSLSEHSLAYILRRYMNTYHMDAIILLIIGLTSLGAFAFDREKGNQIELMYTEPVSRKKYYINKYLATYIISIIFLGIIVMAIGISSYTIGGIGDFKFPIIHYDTLIEHFSLYTKGYFHIIPIWIYNLKIILMLVLQLAFITSVGTLVSIYCKDRMQVFLSTFGLISIGLFLSKLLPKNINILSPFNHLQAGKIANGAIKMKYNMPNHNIYLSVIVLIVSTIVLIIIGMTLNKNKEIG